MPNFDLLHLAEGGILSVRDDMNEFKKVGRIKFSLSKILKFFILKRNVIALHSKQKPIENIPGLNHTIALIFGFLELSNVNIVVEQVNCLELIRFL